MICLKSHYEFFVFFSLYPFVFHYWLKTILAQCIRLWMKYHQSFSIHWMIILPLHWFFQLIDHNIHKTSIFCFLESINVIMLKICSITFTIQVLNFQHGLFRSAHSTSSFSYKDQPNFSILHLLSIIICWIGVLT